MTTATDAVEADAVDEDDETEEAPPAGASLMVPFLGLLLFMLLLGFVVSHIHLGPQHRSYAASRLVPFQALEPVDTTPTATPTTTVAVITRAVDMGNPLPRLAGGDLVRDAPETWSSRSG